MHSSFAEIVSGMVGTLAVGVALLCALACVQLINMGFGKVLRWLSARTKRGEPVRSRADSGNFS